MKRKETAELTVAVIGGCGHVGLPLGVKFALAGLPDSIKANSVSGNITLALPEGASFTAKLDTVSGSLSCAFAGTLGSDLVIVGDGKAEYRFSTVSGNLAIEKN